MEDIGTGAGLAALGFWCFIAAIVVASVWHSIRKREAQHETLRRVIESGQTIDDELTDKLLSLTTGSKELDRDLKVSGWIMLFTGVGLAIMGWAMSSLLAEELLFITLGVSPLVALIGVGFFVASYVVGRWYREDDGSSGNTSKA